MSEYPRGSEWRKWDLHIHTPESHLYNEFKNDWDNYVKELFNKAIKYNISVIGITDYFTIDGYKKIKHEYLQNNTKLKKLFLSDETIKKIKKIVIFPNIEFRLNKLIGTNRINFHVIFSNDISIEDIEENFLHEIDFVFEGNPQSSDEKWKLKINNLTNLGHKLKQEQSTFKGSDIEIGMLNAVVDDSQILDILCDKPTKFNNKYLIIVPSDEDLSKISWNGQDHQTRKVIIQKSNCLFSANDNTIKWGLGEKSSSKKKFIKEFKSLKPCLLASDAHSTDKFFIHNTNKFCWIKADPTFEGLKQIIYEPDSRIKIQNEKPISPFRKISKVTLNFPDDIEINLVDKGTKDKLCLSGIINKEIYFSDYFTTFIGGRGTGKSTLLNIIYKAFQNEIKTEFFKKNKLTKKDKDINISDYITFESSANKIEFLEQNQIEEFATNPIIFTKAIQERLRNEEICNLEKLLLEKLNKIDSQIEYLNNQKSLELNLENLNKNYEAAIKLINTLSNENYKTIIQEINKLNIKFLTLRAEREKIDNLRNDIHLILKNHTKYHLSGISSNYLISYNNFLEKLDLLQKDILDENNFKNLMDEETESSRQLDLKKIVLGDYLKEQGLTEENMQDIKTATTIAEVYKIELDKLKIELEKLKIKIKEFSIEEIKKLNDNYESLIKERIKEFKKVLDDINIENPNDIDKINLNYNFNDDLVKEKIFDDFYNMFSEFWKYRTGKDDVYKCLSKISIYDIKDDKITYHDFLKQITGNHQYNIFLQDIFINELNYEIYKLIIKKHIYNNCDYLKIDVDYRGKSINQASFGQKCTAAIVIMLLFGHNPIIIDEPEAHLDNSLIANYLVKLILKQKINRQIIFATHNANFVINADSEQIYILDMPDKQTQLTQTTIENIKHREELLKLEGGKIAFEKRENRYEIKNIIKD